MSGVRAVVSLSLSLAVAGFAACQKDSLQPGGPSGGIKPFPDGGPGSTGAAGAGGTTGTFDGGFAGSSSSVGAGGVGGGGVAPPDFPTSQCVIRSVLLPWTVVTGTLTPLEVVVSNDGSAIAVLNRQSTQLDVRTYRRDGTLLGGRQFAPDVHLLANSGDHFLLIAHGVSGDFGGTDVNPDLTGGGRTFMVGSTATERLRAVVAGPTATVLLTTERFVNASTGVAVPWTTTLGPDAQAFASGIVYGAAAQGNEILVAGGSGQSLGLMVLDTGGNLVRSGVDTQGLEGPAAADTTTAIPFDGGLLMFNGNPPRLTQIGFDLSRTELGRNTLMETFSRTTPRVAPIVLMGRPVGIWLTVFPGTDNTQGNTLHQLYACALDVADPAGCASTLPIAQTGLNGYGIAQAPIAAAALPDGRTFAVAHSDAANRTWLRITDMMCRPGEGLN